MIRDHEDAFGHAMYDFLHGKPAREIVEREDGYIDVSPGPAYYLSQYKDWPHHYKKAMSRIRGKVLDIGCGAGRISLYLQARGFDVTGIDISPLAIKTCRERGLRKVKVMSITRINNKLGEFDTLVMLGNNFGLMSNLNRARWLLRKFRNITTPGARIVAESLEYVSTKEQYHLQYQKANRKRGRMAGQIKIRVRYLNYKTPWFDYLFATHEEMKQIVMGTGWEVEEYIDSGEPHYITIFKRK
ncbi:MAG: class I SAM-dependent methyltransferase [Candidatus Zixiibacteriota bacterium]